MEPRYSRDFQREVVCSWESFNSRDCPDKYNKLSDGFLLIDRMYFDFAFPVSVFPDVEFLKLNQISDHVVFASQ